MASGKGKRTAMLELASDRGFRWLKEERRAGWSGDAFTYQHIDFFFGRGKVDFASLMNRNYDCVILDLGKNIYENREIFLSCDTKFILCSLQKWKRKEAEIMVERFQNPTWGFITPDFYTFSYSKEERKRFEQRSGIKVKQLPWIPDPFHIEVDQLPELLSMVG